MSHFPPSKQRIKPFDPTIIWSCLLVLDENAVMRGKKKPNEYVYLSLREVLAKIFLVLREHDTEGGSGRVSARPVVHNFCLSVFLRTILVRARQWVVKG